MKHITAIVWIVLAIWFQAGYGQSVDSNDQPPTSGKDFGKLPSAVPVSTLYLTDLVHEALERNPGVISTYNAWLASQARISRAGALPDPALSFNLLNLPVNSFDFNQEPMTGKQIAIMQTFPFPGKLGLKEKIAVEGSVISETQYQEERNQLVKKVKLTYYGLFFIDKAIETTEKNADLVSDFVRIAESKYSVGKGLQQDVLKAQVQLSKMTDRLITLQQKREEFEAQLNALLDRSTGSPVGKPVEPQPSIFARDLSQLEALADQNNPLLKAWKATVRQSEQKVRLARKGYYPDLKIGIAYTQRDVLENRQGGVDYLSASFSVDVPLYFWRKQSKEVEEARYAGITAQEGYRNVRNQIRSALDSKISELRKNQRLLELYKSGIIPQATQSLNSAIAGYRTDKVDFLTMLNNQITLYDYELDYYRFLSDYENNAAELESLVGIQFEEAQ